MSLINREDLIAEYDRVHVGAPGGARKLMVDAPEVKPKQLERCPIYRAVCNYPSDECYDCPRHDPTRIANKLMMPEPKWIPCSEKMPEEDDYKSCIECLDGAVWYFTENGTMGLGYYYESTKEWSTTDDLKTDGKVIAWMPLPERYQEEGE